MLESQAYDAWYFIPRVMLELVPLGFFFLKARGAFNRRDDGLNAAQSSEVHNNVAVEDEADEMETESQRRQDYLRDPLGECSDPDLYG